MFSEIDKTIFPDRCEVLEIVPSQHYVFPIFKCGSSSFHLTAKEKGWKTIVNEQIAQAPSITVFLRDPRDRFISGVNTYVQQCLRDNPGLDQDTIMFFVRQYLFLNSHYAPQMYWLLNLSRYTQAPLILKDMKHIVGLVTKHSDAGIAKPSKDFLQEIDSFPWDTLELYFYLDQWLIKYLDQTVLFTDVLAEFKQQHPDLYKLVFNRTLEFANVLPKT